MNKGKEVGRKPYKVWAPDEGRQFTSTIRGGVTNLIDQIQDDDWTMFWWWARTCEC